MIVKLDNSHRNKLTGYLMKEEEYNLFILGDINNFGLEEEFLEFFAEFNSEHDIIAVMMRFYNEFIIYSSVDTFNVDEFANILISNEFKGLSGKSNVVDMFNNKIHVNNKRNMHFSKLIDDSKIYDYILNYKANITDEQSLNGVFQLYKIEDNGTEYRNKDQVRKEFKNKTARGFHLINKENQVIACIRTSAEYKSSAMITGLCVHPDYRKKGYATALISILCRKLLEEKKCPCLFYDNEKAGRIYNKLGFREIGLWSLWGV